MLTSTLSPARSRAARAALALACGLAAANPARADPTLDPIELIMTQADLAWRAELAQRCIAGTALDCALWRDTFGTDLHAAGVPAPDDLASACDAGDPVACAGAGQADLVDQRVSAALQRLNKACEGGVVVACTWSGTAAIALGQDAEQGIGSLHRACEAGSMDGCWRLGAALSAKPETVEQALTAFGAACRLGSADGCSRSAEPTDPGTAPPPVDRAAKRLAKLCKAGDASACSTRARISEQGLLGTTSAKRIADLYGSGCDLGQDSACADALRAAAGTPWFAPDTAVGPGSPAHDWVDCASGHADACGRLLTPPVPDAEALTRQVLVARHACLLDDTHCASLPGLAQTLVAQDQGAVAAFILGSFMVGAERPTDRTAGGTAIVHACASGLMPACARESLLRFQDKAIEHDAAIGFALAEKSCNAGSGFGCAFLSELYRLGWSVPVSGEKSDAGMQRACELGFARSCEGQHMLQSY